VLFDRGRRGLALKRFDICGDRVKILVAAMVAARARYRFLGTQPDEARNKDRLRKTDRSQEPPLINWGRLPLRTGQYREA